MRVETWNAREVLFNPTTEDLIHGKTTVGIDIGSRQSKAVLLHEDKIYAAITGSDVNSQKTAERLVKHLVKEAEIGQEEIDAISGTGYGRVALNFGEIPTKIITEISCHAMGAHFLNENTKTIIDIGGQDCKAIKIDPKTGHVLEFTMNDKCAAGTGRFLEKTAEMLDYKVEEIGERALESTKPLQISSQCVVFAESEIISLKARGEKREDIAAGIHYAVARRVQNLVKRLDLEPDLIFSGGVSHNLGMRKALEETLKTPVIIPNFDTVYCGALGAAIYAKK
ncbi:MAG: acyl-CoA dehydratase activase [Lachnospiraceae bacterium]